MRFLADLVNAKVVASSSIMTLFDTFITVTYEPDIPRVSTYPNILRVSIYPDIPCVSTYPDIPRHTPREYIPRHTLCEYIPRHTLCEYLPRHTLCEYIPRHTLCEYIPRHTLCEYIPRVSTYPDIPRVSTYTYPDIPHMSTKGPRLEEGGILYIHLKGSVYLFSALSLSCPDAIRLVCVHDPLSTALGECMYMNIYMYIHACMYIYSTYCVGPFRWNICTKRYHDMQYECGCMF